MTQITVYPVIIFLHFLYTFRSVHFLFPIHSWWIICLLKPLLLNRTSARLGFKIGPFKLSLACVHVTNDKLGVLIDEHAGQRQHGAGAAERGQLAAEQQLRQQQVADYVQVAQDMQGDGRGERDDAAAGQIVHDRTQAAEQDEDPQVAVVMQRRLQQGPVLQG